MSLSYSSGGFSVRSFSPMAFAIEQAFPQHSGWFRLWLADLQKKANDAREQPEILQKEGAETQGVKSVPIVIARANPKKKHKAREKPVEVQNLDTGIKLEVPTHYPSLLPYALPDFSVGIYQKLQDAANQEQFWQHKRRREEEALILLLAA